jgi:UDP-GlcNAc:undecaprenyl-phosphate GlcNAc-1-phosphate transferase
LIYGAGDGGELLLRELLNNRNWKYLPVGFLDDDPSKSGKLIHGLRVYGGNGDIGLVCRQHSVEEVLIASSTMQQERLQQILDFCQAQEVTVKRMKITIEDLSEGLG